ncbi:MAG: Rne/Rng family ribonuclease [Cyanobacteria bacterium SZAS LIN-5]|nr:Rne/Rng family ribonuclease [Cyanobacteria bacterium SZAS LIN-5]
MKKSLVISEQDSIAAILENERVVEFFVNRGELLLGDIYSATVENILPGIDAAFVNLGKDKMGFLHANDVPGQGLLKERLVPKQKLLVQITKEPTGHKGPRVSTAISLPGRFLVLVPEERGVSISRRISEARERARLKSVVNLMKPPGVGLIIRTEAKAQGESELFEDFEQLWDRWQTVVSEGEASIGPSLIYRDQDLLFRVIRDAYSNDVSEIICDSQDGQKRAQEYLQGWAGRTTRVSYHTGDDSLLVSKGVDKEIEAALSDRVELPSGGHLNIQPTEALTVIDVNSGRFTSSRTQAETVRRTNVEAAQEIPRQLRLRNIGGMVIVDFIDMDSRKDQQQVLEVFQRVLEEDRAKPQVGQLSDLGLVELTRRRQGQSLRELFTVHCTGCSGLGVVPTLELGTAEHRRVISFKSPEETTKTRGGNNRRPLRQQNAGGGQLRAATAHNGRILPTVDEAEEEDFTDVPEEILDQMPDDLLADPAERELKGGVKRAAYNESESEDEEDNDQAQFDAHNEDFAPKANLFEESFSDDDEEESTTLTENITAVEHVFNEMGARPRQETPAEQIAAEASEVRPYEQAEPHVHAEPEESSQEEQPEVSVEHETEEDLVSFADSSPFQTEYDPVTGTYRLKARVVESESQQEGASQHSEHHDHGHSHEHEHAHSHEHNGEHAHQHEHGHNEHEHSHEHGHDHSHEHGHEQHGHESGSSSMQGEQLNLFGANEHEDTSGSHQSEAPTWNDTTGDASEGGQEEHSEQHEQSVYSGSQQWGEDNG